jgi:hypothetical protein
VIDPACHHRHAAGAHTAPTAHIVRSVADDHNLPSLKTCPCQLAGPLDSARWQIGARLGLVALSPDPEQRRIEPCS